MIFVTGGTGRVGKQLIELLLKNGIKVKVLVKNPQKGANLSKSGVPVVIGDLNRPEVFSSALCECDRLISIPANTINQAEQEIRLFQAAKRAKIEQIVKLSTIKANLKSTCHFFQQHAIAEQYLKQSDLNFTILKANSFMQNFLWFASEIKTQGTLSLPMKDSKIVPVDIFDIVNIARIILTTEKYREKTYNITGSQMFSLSEIAKKISLVAGKKITYVDVSPINFKQTLLQFGLQDWYAESIVAAWQVATEEQATITDVVTEITDKQPTTFEQFAKKYQYVFN